MGNEDNAVTWLGSALAASRGLKHLLASPHTELGQVLCFFTKASVAWLYYRRCHCSGSFALFHIIFHRIPINLKLMLVQLRWIQCLWFLPTQLACVCNTKERAILGNCVAIGNPKDQLSPSSDDYCLAYGAAEWEGRRKVSHLRSLD